MPLVKRIKNTYLFPNGNLAVFGFDGQQIPELQGAYSIDKHKRILLEAREDCEFSGFDILPIGFIEHAKRFSDYFKERGLSWEEIEEVGD
jgi:hypothetical protein